MLPERIKDMDVDGIYAELYFPTFPGFAGSTFFDGDREFGLGFLIAFSHLDYV